MRKKTKRAIGDDVESMTKAAADRGVPELLVIFERLELLVRGRKSIGLIAALPAEQQQQFRRWLAMTSEQRRAFEAVLRRRP